MHRSCRWPTLHRRPLPRNLYLRPRVAEIAAPATSLQAEVTGANGSNMKMTEEPAERNSLEAEAKQAIEDEARAIEDEGRAKAEAVRARGRTQLAIAAMLAVAAKAGGAASDLDVAAAAKAVGATITTFKRANIEPDYFVGTRPRWRDAESVRAKFAARGKLRTTPESKKAMTKSNEDLDVTSTLAASGLRVVGGRAQ